MPYLYFIRAEKTNRVKIGYTGKTVTTRKSQLQVGSSVALTIEHEFEVSKPQQAEQIVHKDLQLYRIHGEWFEIDAEHLEAYIEAFKEVRLGNLI